MQSNGEFGRCNRTCDGTNTTCDRCGTSYCYRPSQRSHALSQWINAIATPKPLAVVEETYQGYLIERADGSRVVILDRKPTERAQIDPACFEPVCFDNKPIPPKKMPRGVHQWKRSDRRAAPKWARKPR